MFKNFFALFSFLLVLSPFCSAAVYKCQDASGETTYQSSPCPETEKSKRIVILQAPTITPGERMEQMRQAQIRQELNDERQAEDDDYNRRSSSSQSDPADSYDCQQARRNLEVQQSSIVKDRDKEREYQRDVDRACSTPEGFAASQEERAASENAEAARRESGCQSTIIVHCVPGGCNDNCGHFISNCVQNGCFRNGQFIPK
jgi:hypothetical protein